MVADWLTGMSDQSLGWSDIGQITFEKLFSPLVNLFRVHLITICNKNHLNTLVSMSRCKQKPPYDILFGVARRPGEFGEVC